MALPSSGAISLSQVNTELGVSATATRSLGDSTTRALFGVASGAISMSQGYGKANQFSFVISANQTNANLRTLAINAGWNQTSKVVATINSGVYVSSNGTGTPALTANGSFPGGVQLINNGFIVGMGGAGGRGGEYNANNGVSGNVGGLALSVSSSITITNNGTIAGGGGGGGGGSLVVTQDPKVGNAYGGGGGGGGGRSSNAANSAAGAGGYWPGGNGVAGGVGTVSGPGSGGTAAYSSSYCRGGNGGGWGASGAAGGNMPGFIFSPGGGGSAGAAISGNSNITWAATGTRLGAIG
jgi:hypothetical protein